MQQTRRYSTKEDQADPDGWSTSASVEDRKSVFVGRAAAAASASEAQAKVLRLIDRDKRMRKATHQIIAWRVSSGSCVGGYNSFRGGSSSNSSSSSNKAFTSKKTKSVADNTAGTTSALATNETLDEHYDNGGEPPAGERVLSMLRGMGLVGVVVVVTRWYGGVKLGGDRFRHVTTTAQQALEAGGFFTKSKSKKK